MHLQIVTENGPKLIIAICILGAIVVFFVVDECVNRRILFREPDRKILSIDEIYELHYANSEVEKTEFIDLWTEIASTLEINSGKLRPSDRFGTDVGDGVLVTDRLDELTNCASQRIRLRSREAVNIENVESLLNRIKTVDDYVKILAQISKSRPTE